MTGDDLRYLLWPANPLLPAEFTFDEAGLRQTPATAYELILRAHADRQAGLWQLPDDPFDPAEWLLRSMPPPLPVYAGPTVLEYRRRPTLRRWPGDRYWLGDRYPRGQSWLRVAVAAAVAASGLPVVYYRGGRVHTQPGARRPDWLDELHRAIAELTARRHRLLVESAAARELAAEFGTSTLTDVEHWTVAEQVDQLFADGLLVL